MKTESNNKYRPFYISSLLIAQIIHWIQHEIIGMYPAIKGMELAGGGASKLFEVPEYPRMYRPIETRENFKMLFRGETPYWMVNNGWVFCDINEFRPRQTPDCIAHHQCLDGGPFIDYTKRPRVTKGWFNLPLEWEPLSAGATTRPGNPIMPEIEDWREVLQWPNLDDIDFEEMGEMNKEYLGTDKPNQLGIQLGLWERMMCLMDVENAAMCLLDENVEDDVHAFLDKLSDFYIDYIGRVMKVCRIDSIMLHDDWGTQNGPFFSLDTAIKFFVPPMKKIVDFCHANDIVFEHHCCGKAEALVPAMVMTGSDFWFPQAAINDVDALIEKYKDKGVLFCQDVSKDGMLGHDSSLYPIFADAVYEYSRIAYQDVE